MIRTKFRFLSKKIKYKYACFPFMAIKRGLKKVKSAVDYWQERIENDVNHYLMYHFLHRKRKKTDNDMHTI